MKICLTAFTARGRELAGKLAASLGGEVNEGLSLKEWTEHAFETADALVFVGAVGIAVRAIAPHIVHKSLDPAVVVIDEGGSFAVSLLSGHLGGANELARKIAAAVVAEAVITTATDVNRRFSVDAWAAANGLWISDMGAAKRFAAEILRRDLPLASDFTVKGTLPGGVYAGNCGDLGVAISCHRAAPFKDTLLLVPRRLHLGIGCKRGAPVEKLRAAVDVALAEAGLCRHALRCAASIDVKRDEPGLRALCAELDLPLRVYSAEELMAVQGDFEASEFVRSTVGADNVCERSAVRSAGESATVLVHKRRMDGVTVAIAQEDWSVSFE